MAVALPRLDLPRPEVTCPPPSAPVDLGRPWEIHEMGEARIVGARRTLSALPTSQMMSLKQIWR